MANPLSSRLAVAETNSFFASVDDMREWCWVRNQRAIDADWLHWMHVSHDKTTGVNSIKSRVGSDARDVLNVINGSYPDYQNWSAEQLSSEYRILRHMARMGMTEERAQAAKFKYPPKGQPALDLETQESATHD